MVCSTSSPDSPTIMRCHLTRPLSLLTLLSVLAACESQSTLTTQPVNEVRPSPAGTTTNANPATPATPATPTVPTTPTTPPPGGTGSGTTTPDLDARLKSEEARIAARQIADQAAYDSLKVIWQQVLDDTTGRYADSLVCDPKQYVASAKIIGPEGGDINFGEHSFRIPAGALSAPTVITAEAPASIRVLAIFSPSGTRFNAGFRPTLELSYKHCRGPLTRAAKIAYVSNNGQILAWPPSQDFPDLGLVRGLIEHFSNYIVAY